MLLHALATNIYVVRTRHPKLTRKIVAQNEHRLVSYTVSHRGWKSLLWHSVHGIHCATINCSYAWPIWLYSTNKPLDKYKYTFLPILLSGYHAPSFYPTANKNLLTTQMVGKYYKSLWASSFGLAVHSNHLTHDSHHSLEALCPPSV